MLSTKPGSKHQSRSLQSYTWPFTILVALGGLWWPRLGVLVIPIMVTLLIMSFFRGRYWCGNVCSHGSLYDHVLGPISRNRALPKLFRSPFFAWGFFLFFAYNIVRRLLVVTTLWGSSSFWDRLGFIFVMSYLMVLIVGGVLAVFFKPRTWCSFCPMGTMQKLSYRLGKLSHAALHADRKVTISDPERCRACGKCAKVCPMGLSPYLAFSDSNQFDSEDCIRCGKCVEVCPFSLLSIDSPLDMDGNRIIA